MKKWWSRGYKEADMLKVMGFYGAVAAALFAEATAFGQPADAVASAQVTAQEAVFGLSWAPPTQGAAANHTYPFVWTYPADTSAATISATVTSAKALPAGRAVLFIWDGQRAVIGNSADNCIDPTTGLATTSLCPYLNNGVAAVKAVFQNFYSTYYAAGGPLDFLVLDSEIGLDSYSIAVDDNNNPNFWNWNYVQNDSRFATTLGPDLTNMATAGGFPNLPFTPLTTYVQWSGVNSTQYQVWNELMYEWVGSDLAAAVYAPMNALYPNASASDLGYFLHDPSFPVYNYFGSVVSTFGHGVQQGNTGAPQLYGTMGPNWEIPAGQAYPATPFNVLRFDTNTVRAAVLGTQKMQTAVSVAPWVPYRGYSASLYANSDFYQEMLFHAALSGAGYFLYWNPKGQSDNQQQDDPIFDAAMSELNNLVGYSNRQTSITSLASWTSNSLVTTARAGARKVSRVTPAPINSVLTLPTCKANGRRVLACTFADGSVVHFPSGSVYTPASPASAYGIWVTQPIWAGNPY